METIQNIEDPPSSIPPSSTQNIFGFTSIEEIIQEYMKNEQEIINELIEGLMEVYGTIDRLNAEIQNSLISEEKKRTNLIMLKSNCCRITKEFYTTIKMNFNGGGIIFQR